MGTQAGVSEGIEPFDAESVAEKATELRRDIVAMLTEAGSGHPGGSLSAADIVATLYFGGILRHDPTRPDDPSRDRFILSKGHAAPVLYAALAEDGYLPLEELGTLRKLGSRLQGHPDSKKLPGVEVSTGSLGQGLSIATGLAAGLAMGSDGGDDVPFVYVLMGDGEMEEGQVWEAAMYAARLRLANLVAIVDNNDLQIDGRPSELVGLTDIAGRLAAFGWRTVEIDGNDISQVHDALVQARQGMEGPVAIIAHTVKGKGVSFMEDQVGWHGKAPSHEQASQAFEELGGAPEWYRAAFEGRR